MRSKRTSSSSLALELASHAAMGTALGLGFCFALAFIEPATVAALIGHAEEPGTTAIVLLSFFTLIFGVGATMTGLVFTTTENTDRANEK